MVLIIILALLSAGIVSYVYVFVVLKKEEEKKEPLYGFDDQDRRVEVNQEK